MQAVDETASVVGLSAEASRVLLRQFKWNREMLLEKWATKDTGCTCEQSKLINILFEVLRPHLLNIAYLLLGQDCVGKWRFRVVWSKEDWPLCHLP